MSKAVHRVDDHDVTVFTMRRGTLNQSRNRAVVQGLVTLSSAPEGFPVPELAEQVRHRLNC